jgi:hypothetical protein
MRNDDTKNTAVGEILSSETTTTMTLLGKLNSAYTDDRIESGTALALTIPMEGKYIPTAISKNMNERK